MAETILLRFAVLKDFNLNSTAKVTQTKGEGPVNLKKGMKKPWSPWHTVFDFDSVNGAHGPAHPGFTLGLVSFDIKAVWALDCRQTLKAHAVIGRGSVEENTLPYVHDAMINQISVNVHDNPIRMPCRQVCRKKKPWTCSIVGRLLGMIAQQLVMRFHKSSEIRFCPSGRGGFSILVVLTLRTVGSSRRWENGCSSVMHSSISIANEYVSELAVAGTVSPWKNSGAEYLKRSSDNPPVEETF